jgi:2'-5' RNA ligase
MTIKTTLYEELMKDPTNVGISTATAGTQLTEKATSRNETKNKRKEQYEKTKHKTLLQRKNKYHEDKKKLNKIKSNLEKAFRDIPDSDLVTVTSNRVILSKSKLYKLTYRIVRK